MKNQTVINEDVFDISKRLKEIDESYFLVYNFEKGKFEVHTNEQDDGYCFTVPFDFLDSRTIEYARKTAKSRRDEIFKEIDAHNQKVQDDAIKQTIENLKGVME